jgi:hypothetical protein
MAVLLAVPAVILTLVWLVASVAIGVGLRCDESCTGEGWRRTNGGWQWNLVPLVGAIAVLAALALVRYVRRGQPLAAAISLLIATGAVLFDVSWIEPGWRDHVDRHTGLTGLCAGVFVCALVAVLFAVPASDRPGET